MATIIAKVTQKSSSYLGNYETLLLSASFLCRQSTLYIVKNSVRLKLITGKTVQRETGHYPFLRVCFLSEAQWGTLWKVTEVCLMGVWGGDYLDARLGVIRKK